MTITFGSLVDSFNTVPDVPKKMLEYRRPYKLNYHNQKIRQLYMWYTEPLDSCFNLIISHQQSIPWSHRLEIKPVTTECRAETQTLSYWSTLHTSDAKLKNKKRTSQTLLFDFPAPKVFGRVMSKGLYIKQVCSMPLSEDLHHLCS